MRKEISFTGRMTISEILKEGRIYMFSRCCDCRNEISYNILHNPKPISLEKSMEKILKYLLWYVPNIESIQSPKIDLIENELYDDFTFDYILHMMGMSENDVEWLEPNVFIDDDTWRYYEDSLCLNCQKMIITRIKKQSKTQNLLRCIRNSVAHGHFTICDNMFIGFNKHKPNGGVEQHKAIIKIYPDRLLNAIKQLSSPIIKELLIKYAFERVGYKVSAPPIVRFGGMMARRLDWLIEKNDKKYYIEIKDYDGVRFLHSSHLVQVLSYAKEMNDDIPIVVMIDTSRITKEIKNLTSELGTIFILDINLIKDLLSGVDVLEKRDDIK